jgi:branched-chain amino acid transport system ATP-binding protein
MKALLEVRGVKKTFGGVVANEDVSLTVPEGAIVGLIGPNGSGKTTLFNSIVGYHAIDAGSIRFAGRELSRLRVPQIARLGLIRTFQQTRIYGDMSCMRNMLVSIPAADAGLFSMFWGFPRPQVERAEALLEFVGLHEKRELDAGDLSFGQQKLLELAMALMTEPRMLLLDEPTAGINPSLINDLVGRLKRINTEFGVTLLVIEHNMRVITALAQRIHCLAHGKLLAEGTPGEITANPQVIEAYLGAQ